MSRPDYAVVVRGWLDRELAVAIAEVIAASRGLPRSVAVTVEPGGPDTRDRSITVVRPAEPPTPEEG